ncbi:MAG: ARMT1-like domain-containing protein, partial [bacterium]|nr:ARMT1-like domain-containing protein [bacterium]
SGMDAPGTILHLCSKEFNELFRKSDFIISKGQGNFEGLSKERGGIFFLLKAKCKCIADELNVPLGSLIFKYAK